MPRLFVGTFLSNEGVEKLANLSQANEHLQTAWNAKVRWVDRSKFHITWVFLGEIESKTIPDVIGELKLAFGEPTQLAGLEANVQLAEARLAEPQLAEPRIAKPQLTEPQLTETQHPEPQLPDPQLADALFQPTGSAGGPLTLMYEKFEVWPSERKARLAVVTPSTVPDEVLQLDKRIKNALAKFLQSDQSQHELKDFKPHITVLRFPRDHHHKPNSKTKVSDIATTDALFPIRHEIHEIALIESELGNHVDGYRKLATFQLC
ncbi:MAG: hypothetical protein SGJ27_04585 [Candidatus Melainabacteria bacterium]|nr:hypothetical protein [Candidatus Melainabacteria bacterium]